MKNKALILIVTLLSAGCAHNEVVKVPVPVSCKTSIPEAPQYTFEQLAQSDDIYTKVRALLADRELSKAYETELLAALKSCK